MRRLFAVTAVALLALAEVPPAGADGVQATELAIEATIPREAATMAYGFGALWTMSDGKVLRLDPADNSVTEIEVPGAEGALLLSQLDRYRGLAIGEGALWVPDMASSTILKVDPEKREVIATIPTDIFGSFGSIGVGEGSVWVVTFDSHDKTLTRYDAETGAVQARIALPRASRGVLAAYGSLWVSASNRPELYRVDPVTDSVVATIPLPEACHQLAAGHGSIWVACDVAGVVQRIDGQTGQVLATIDTGAKDMESDGDIAVGGGYVWTINRGAIIARIDPATNTVLGLFHPPPASNSGRRISFGDDALWLSGNGIYRALPPQ